MDLVMRLVRALLLLALLLAVAPLPGAAKELCPEPCRCPGRGRLNCGHAGLATVPPSSRQRALAVLDFTGNSIAAVGKQAWKDYPWTETLVLRDNKLRAVKSHSLEGLFLLKHLDLSCNEILSIEERAFEPLPFLKFLNLSGNGLTRIRSGAFQAWHGMQFLQELILSHNPLAVIADAAFFKLPSVSSLQVPKEAACCLCQEHPRPESPCRTIQFLCQKLCSTSASQCAHTTLLQTRGEIMDMEERRELNSSPVLSLKPKEPSLGDHGTVTLEVALTPSTEGDVSSLDSSRTNSFAPQHLLGHKGKTSADDLRAKLKKKLHKSKSTKTAKTIVPHQPQPAWLKHVVEKTPSSWDHKQQESHLNRQALNPWDVAGGLKPTHGKSLDRPLRDEVEGQAPRQNYIMTIKEQQDSQQKQLDSRLNWQILNPWDVAGGLNPNDDDSISGHHRDKEKDPAPRQNFVNFHKQPKKQDSQYWVGHNRLFYQVLSPVKAEGEPRATGTKDEQHLNRNLDFLSDPLVQSGPAASSGGGATAEEEQSFLGGHLLIMPDTRDTHGKQQEEGSRFLNKPWSPQSPDIAPVPRELLETTVDHHLRLVLLEKSLQTFLAHVERARSKDCSLPQLKLACAKMVSKTGLLLKVLSERQENQGASDPMGRCPLQENISRGTAVDEDQEPTEKPKPETMDDMITVLLLSVIAVILLILKGLFHVCSRCAAAVCRQLLRRKSWLRRLSVKLQERWRKNKYREAEGEEQVRAGSRCQFCSSACTACSSSPLQILPFHGNFQYLPELSEAELLLVQYIMDVLDKEEEELQEQMQKENTDVSQEEAQCEELEWGREDFQGVENMKVRCQHLFSDSYSDARTAKTFLGCYFLIYFLGS
ncbi:uncharacterized protein LOC128800395 isoform X3 [Vidua chalybeata]|uniref:uncharacterized protein LOC128800395 isoform X3 n=1 Tax=Vidua chalybeata TaxID=81927 RepID=UPI0023A80A16|nr:uncharacterized protein LOC128800395 isoform X3 [Vidua chalybeata]